MLNGSSVFGSMNPSGDSKLDRFYEEQVENFKFNPNVDCSELTEDFLNEFDGTALLILHKNYSRWKEFKVTDSNEDEREYVYHYAFISSDRKVYDVMLGYKGLSLDDYLEKIKVKELNEPSDFTIEEIKNTKMLKSYI